MASRRIRDLNDLRALSDKERSDRRRALRALSLARAEGWPVEVTAEAIGLDMSVVRDWAADALEPTRKGSSYPKPSDAITRFRPLYVDGKADLVAAQGSAESDLFADIFDAQYRYIAGDAPASGLRDYEGIRTSDERVVDTDPEVLKRAALEEPDIDPYRGLF